MPRTPGTRIGNGSGQGVGQGPGWGGPAKGAGVWSANPYTTHTPTRRTIPGGKGDPGKRAARDAKRLTQCAKADELRALLSDLAFFAEREETRLSAAIALLNRLEGLPVARNVNVAVNDISKMSDAELEAEIAGYHAKEATLADAGKPRLVPIDSEEN